MIDVQNFLRTFYKLIGRIESSVIGPFFFLGTEQIQRAYQDSGTISASFLRDQISHNPRYRYRWTSSGNSLSILIVKPERPGLLLLALERISPIYSSKEISWLRAFSIALRRSQFFECLLKDLASFLRIGWGRYCSDGTERRYSWSVMARCHSIDGSDWFRQCHPDTWVVITSWSSSYRWHGGCFVSGRSKGFVAWFHFLLQQAAAAGKDN